jgi:hypothetical protein
MKCQHEPKAREKEPVGNLCVIRDESLNSWTVQVCPGAVGTRKPLAKFSTRGEAEAFARLELVKMNSGAGAKVHILHVDDCPCWQKQL